MKKVKIRINKPWLVLDWNGKYYCYLMVYKYTYIIIEMNIDQECVNICTYAHMCIHTFSVSVQERALDQ